MINVEVTRNSNENSTSLIRRFTKRMQGSGVLPRVRSIRYNKRSPSKFLSKKKTIKKIENRAKYEELLKLGKVVERTRRRR